jgi:predicted RNA binding protein YcfA (HicA-like mRNA interferase family)
MSKDVKSLVKEAAARGWQATTTRNGHLRLTHPHGGLVFIAGTPSDHRAMTNMRCEIKRQERRWSA